MAYDGTDFVSVNDDAVLTASGKNKPVDTWLRQRIRGNAEYLIQGRDNVTIPIAHGTTLPADGAPFYSDRPWCSIDWTSPVCIPFKILSGLAGVVVSLWGTHSANVPNGSSKDVGVRISIIDGNGRVIGATSDVIDDGDIEQFGAQRFTLTLNSPYAGPEHIGMLLVSVKSGLEETDITAITGASVGNLRTLAADDYGVVTYATNRPGGNTADVAYVQSNDTGDVADIIAVGEGGASSGPDMLLLDRTMYQISGGEYDTRAMSYFQCRSVTIQTLFAENLISVTRDSLAAQKPELGSLAMAQWQQARYAHSRERLIAAGPSGYLPPNVNPDNWGTTAVRWRSVQSNAAGLEKTLLDTCIHLRGDSPRVHVYMFLITCLHTVGGRDVGSSEWDLTATLEQQLTADWATKTTLATATLDNEVLKTYPTARAQFQDSPERHLVLRQWIRRGNRGGIYSTGTDNWFYSPKEGQLWSEDLDLIQVVKMTLEPTITGTDLADSMRLRVQGDYVDGSLKNFSVYSTSMTQLTYDLETTCVGWAVYQEVPE